MFEPNLIGSLSIMTGRDIHGRSIYATAVDVAFAYVNGAMEALKTTVRADSSASRGAADEMTGSKLKILIDQNAIVSIGDRFEHDGSRFVISGRHVRRSVWGEIDHFECDLAPLP